MVSEISGSHCGEYDALIEKLNFNSGNVTYALKISSLKHQYSKLAVLRICNICNTTAV
jgi:hypothetical protein